MRSLFKSVVTGLMVLSLTACATYIEEEETLSQQTLTLESCVDRGGKLETRKDGVQVCKVARHSGLRQEGSVTYSKLIATTVFVIAAVALASGSGGGGGGGFADGDL